MANEPLLTLMNIPETKNVEVVIDFINWRSYEANCNQIIIDTSSEVSGVKYSRQIDGVTTSNLWPVEDSAAIWNMLEKYTFIDVNSKTLPLFSDRIKFILFNSLSPDRTGNQLASSFGVSGKVLKGELPFF